MSYNPSQPRDKNGRWSSMTGTQLNQALSSREHMMNSFTNSAGLKDKVRVRGEIREIQNEIAIRAGMK